MEAVENGIGLVVSDLHLGQFSTTGNQALRAMHREIRAAKPSVIVLNGDIIEGKELGGSLASIDRHIQANTDKIRTLVVEAMTQNAQCRIAYVIGNHDNSRQVLQCLERLADEFPEHFSIHPEAIRIRDSVFTHGDLQMLFKDSSNEMDLLKQVIRGKIQLVASHQTVRGDSGYGAWRTSRAREGLDEISVNTKSLFMGVADQALSRILFPMDKVAPAIHATLMSQCPELMDGAKRVMIGHIHSPHATHHTHEGVEFRVTGPATQLSHNTMYRFTVNDRTLDQFECFKTKFTDRPVARAAR